MKEILNLCTGILGLYLFCVIVNGIIQIIKSAYSFLRYRKHVPLNFREIFLLNIIDNSKIIIIFAVILSIGAGNKICSLVFASNQIGAFYERAEYTENYEALIYPSEDADPIFCIAEISREQNEYDKRIYDYHIWKVYLPYNQRIDTDAEYDPESETGRINGEYGSYTIKLKTIADKDSFIMLDNMILSSDGYIVASKSSDTYHLEDCKYVKTIKPENLVRFDDPRQAELFGFYPCRECPF